MRSKITSKMKFNSLTPLDGPPRSIHVLLTHEQNGLRVAVFVDLKNRDQVSDTLIVGNIVKIRNALLENNDGCDKVYAYLAVHKGRCKCEWWI